MKSPGQNRIYTFENPKFNPSPLENKIFTDTLKQYNLIKIFQKGSKGESSNLGGPGERITPDKIELQRWKM